MTDLEDVISDLFRFRRSLENNIEFIDRLIKLFGSWDAAVDMGCNQETTMSRIFDTINNVLLGDSEDD